MAALKIIFNHMAAKFRTRQPFTAEEPFGERKGGIRAGVWIEKDGLHGERRQIPKSTGRASKENLPRGSRRKHERVSGRKSSSGRSAESWFHSKSGQT